MTDPHAALSALFDAERALRRAEAQLLSSPEDVLTQTLSDAVAESLQLKDAEERQLQLTRLVDLCAQHVVPQTVDAMVAALDDHDKQVRGETAAALLDVAYNYYVEVASAIDRALDRGTQLRALAELPFLLSEVGEPGATPQLRRFLKHGDANVIASAIEASIQLMDDSLLEDIERHLGDERDVTIDEFERETSVSLGQLAAIGAEALRSLDKA